MKPNTNHPWRKMPYKLDKKHTKCLVPGKAEYISNQILLRRSDPTYRIVPWLGETNVNCQCIGCHNDRLFFRVMRR